MLKTNNEQYLYTGNFEGLKGIILESRGGAKNSDNARNVSYKLLLQYILEKFQNEKRKNIQIFVASRNNVYKNLDDRKIIIDNNDTFDFGEIDLDNFITKLSSEIKKSGQKGDEKGGNSTKRLFFYEKENQNITTYFNKDVFLSVLKNFKFDYNKKPTTPKILQQELCNFLKREFSNYNWQTEFRFDEKRKDSFDIYGENNGHHIIIELDPHRADSISKKFVSRIALAKSLQLTYVCFLYKGTKKMNPNEADKYIHYCETLIEMLNNDNIDSQKEFIGYCHYDKK